MRFMSVAPLLLALACNGGSATGGKQDSTVPNNKPVAEAGTPITQSADLAVDLNGGASRDPDGDALSYRWTFDHVPDGSLLPNKEAPFTSNGATTPTTSFIPDKVGTYVVKLEVTDTKGATSDPDFVVVTIEDSTALPVANAGSDLTVRVGQQVTLNGAGSYDPQGRAFTYAWTVIDKPSASGIALSGDTTVSPTFTPDAKGVYIVNLVVNNGLASSRGDAMTVTALADDHAPVANAGVDIETEDCTSVPLDCSSSSDPDGDTLIYLWDVQSKPTGSTVSSSSFTNRAGSRPSFYPDVAGDYTLSCAVFDGTTWSSPDLVKLSATERRRNAPPSVNAGPNESVDADDSAQCVESGYTYECEDCSDKTYQLGLNAQITDADGDPMTYLWEVLDGDATITDPTNLNSTVKLKGAATTEPSVCTENEYTFRITATDCTGESDSDTISILVNCCGVLDSSN